jgi:hypothetical protein
MTQTFSSWHSLPSSFAATIADMSSEDAAAPAIVAAAATPLAHIHLDSFIENNVELWLSRHETMWYVNNVTKSLSKYQLVRSALPRTIMDVYGTEIASISLGPDPYAVLCDFLIKNFGKNKWFSYFQLLSLPIAVENVRPLELLGKLKNHLPFGASDNNELFMAMFLMRLPESTREAVGAANHATVTAMCAHAENMYNFRGGYESMTAAAAVQQRSRSPAKTDRKRSEKQGKARSKNHSINVSFFAFKNPNNGSCKFHNYFGVKAEKCISPCNVTEN